VAFDSNEGAYVAKNLPDNVKDVLSGTIFMHFECVTEIFLFGAARGAEVKDIDDKKQKIDDEKPPKASEEQTNDKHDEQQPQQAEAEAAPAAKSATGDVIFHAPPVRVRGLYRYEAQTDEELSFECDEVLLLTEEHASGWWHGLKLDSTLGGFFPEGFVTKEFDDDDDGGGGGDDDVVAKQNNNNDDDNADGDK
jgi:hypothetical protein